jgi:hypothetical protein
MSSEAKSTGRQAAANILGTNPSHLPCAFEPSILWIVADRTKRFFVDCPNPVDRDNRLQPSGRPFPRWRERTRRIDRANDLGSGTLRR